MILSSPQYLGSLKAFRLPLSNRWGWRRGRLLAVLLFVLVLASSAVNAQEEEGLPWREEWRLTWEDFKGGVPMGAQAAATTASGISYSYQAEWQGRGDVQVVFDVKAHFYPTESWYRPSVCDDHILNHEQLHFDIAEIFARKLRQRLESKKYTRNIKSEVKEIYQQTVRDLSKFQKQYDRETNFSRNRENQLLWNELIGKMLNANTP